MEIKVNIPDGKYCDGCKFLNYYTHNLVNIFGDQTGNIEEGYECKHHNCRLEKEDHDCYCKVKKCFHCIANDSDKALLFLLAYMMFGGDKNGK